MYNGMRKGMMLMKYNLHTHTKRCNHALGEDREYVESAIKAGIKVLGFSDHCPQFFPEEGYYSRFRMRPELAPDYAESVKALQREYKNDIRILLGFETEYYPACFDRFREFIKPLEPDYLLMGQHFIGNEYDAGYAGSAEKNEEYLDRYVAQVKEGLETGAFSCIAHPDIVWYKGSLEHYDLKMRELCRFAAERDIPLEFNMLGFLNRKCYPSPRFWKTAAEAGCKAVIGYDAHTPEMLLEDGLYEECRAVLDSLGISVTPFEEIKLINEFT